MEATRRAAFMVDLVMELLLLQAKAGLIVEIREEFDDTGGTSRRVNGHRARGWESGSLIDVVSAPTSSFVERLRTGDASALNELTAALYRELHRIASRQLRSERSDHTLQATALVHEAYLKLSDSREGNFADHAHFLAVACRVMRQVLVDYARSRSTQKRAGANRHQLITTNLELPGETGMELIDLIELDSALDALAAEDESLARLVEMRYFGGMTAEESAEALGISVHVVRHDLRFAQAWLKRKLTAG